MDAEIKAWFCQLKNSESSTFVSVVKIDIGMKNHELSFKIWNNLSVVSNDVKIKAWFVSKI